jgi:osmotically-inducible protein OsmY
MCLEESPGELSGFAQFVPNKGYIMKQFKHFSTFVLAIMLSAAVGCASTSKQEGTGEYIDDTVITTKVKTALFNEPTLKSAQINVETYKGVVQLSGFVSTQDNIYRAADITRGVSGVTNVKNDMRLR